MSTETTFEQLMWRARAGDQEALAILLRRCASADGLQRFQAGEPSPADPESRGLWAWCRRHPVRALLTLALVVACAGSLAALTVKGIAVWNEMDLKEQARQEEKNRREELEKANGKLEARLYLSQVLLAHRAWLDADTGRANQILDACNPELRGLEWHALKRRSHGPRLSIPIPDQDANLLALSAPGGQGPARLAVAGKSTVRIIDPDAGQVLQALPVGLRAEALALDREGARLAVAAEGDRGLSVWDVDRGNCLWSEPVGDAGQEVQGVLFVEDGAALLTVTTQPGRKEQAGTASLELRRWDARTGKLLGTVAGPRSTAGRTSTSLSPDGRLVAWLSPFDAGGLPLAMPVADTTTGQAVAWLGENKPIRSVAFSQDGQLLATSGRTVKTWQLSPQKEIGTLDETAEGAYALAFSPDGKLATMGKENDLRLWKASGQALGILGRSADTVRGLGFLPTGELVTVRADAVDVWDVGDRGLTIVDTSFPIGIGFRPGPSDVLVSWRPTVPPGDLPGVIEVHDPGAGQPWEIPAGPERIFLSQDGRRMAVVDRDGTRVWDLGSRTNVLTVPGLNGLAFAGDCLLGAAESAAKGTLTVVDLATGKERSLLKGPPNVVQGLLTSEDGRRAVVQYENRSVAVWDLTIGKPVSSFRMPGSSEFSLLALRPDGLQVVLSEGATVIRDAATGNEVSRLTGRGSPITCAAFGPDGRRLLTGSEDGSVKLWDADTGQELLAFRDRRLSVRWVTFSPDGGRFAAGCGGEKSLRAPAAFLIWDARPVEEGK
jgi:WD40 repeat protein